MTKTGDDVAAIVEVTHRYAWAIDDRDWDELRKVFTEDATAALGSECPDVEAIVARIRSVLDPLDSSQHIVGNHLVAVDGDTATCRCYLQAQHTKRQPSGGDNFLIGARYYDQLTRGADGWRIQRRELVILWSEGNVDVIR